uniref:PWWP domain-containing protein n=1 Tax=Xiphophorus maculatus TaxID=8083 RepID=A0A3B5QJM6_XIPMA
SPPRSRTAFSRRCPSASSKYAFVFTPQPTAVSKQPEPITEEGPVPTRFCVGDLVWTKVSGYPWWPCMKAFNSRLGLLYHIQYFGDAPERGFVFEKNMVSFTGEEQYVELSSVEHGRHSGQRGCRHGTGPAHRQLWVYLRQGRAPSEPSHLGKAEYGSH